MLLYSLCLNKVKKKKKSDFAWKSNSLLSASGQAFKSLTINYRQMVSDEKTPKQNNKQMDKFTLKNSSLV